MAFREQRDQHQFEYIRLPDDDLAHFMENGLPLFSDLPGHLDIDLLQPIFDSISFDQIFVHNPQLPLSCRDNSSSRFAFSFIPSFSYRMAKRSCGSGLKGLM